MSWYFCLENSLNSGLKNSAYNLLYKLKGLEHKVTLTVDNLYFHRCGWGHHRQHFDQSQQRAETGYCLRLPEKDQKGTDSFGDGGHSLLNFISIAFSFHEFLLIPARAFWKPWGAKVFLLHSCKSHSWRTHCPWSSWGPHIKTTGSPNPECVEGAVLGTES